MRANIFWVKPFLNKSPVESEAKEKGDNATLLGGKRLNFNLSLVCTVVKLQTN